MNSPDFTASPRGKQVRVCLVTSSFSPDLGGLAAIVTGLAQGLTDIGCLVEVATQTTTKFSATAVSNDTTSFAVHRFVNRLGGRRFGYAPSLSRWVRRNESRFDVVHAFSYHAPAALATSLSANKPFFFTPTFHGGGHSRLAKLVHLAYRPVAATIFRRSEAVFCGSEAERTTLLGMYPFCAEWTRVVAFVVSQSDASLVVPFVVARPVILSAGRLDVYKRNDALVDAMTHLQGRAELVICGAGPDRRRLEELATERGVAGDVHFAGYVSDDDLARWQRTATVVASLSTHESFGLSLAEGAVVGANVVASDIPAHREVATLLDFPATFVSVGASSAAVAAALSTALDQRTRDPSELVQHTWAERAYETLASYEEGIQNPRRR